jgi:hypothetical protein
VAVVAIIVLAATSAAMAAAVSADVVLVLGVMAGAEARCTAGTPVLYFLNCSMLQMDDNNADSEVVSLDRSN